MKTIVFISAFDPINNRFIEAFKKFNEDKCDFIFYMLNSSLCSKENRLKMIDLALESSGINYSTKLDVIDKKLNTIDLCELFNKLKNDGLENLFLLIIDDDDYLLDSNKILKLKAKYNYNSSFEDSQKQIRDLVNLELPKNVIDYIVEKQLYFMESIIKYVDGKRLEHSISVANVAYRIALDNKIARFDLYFIAGLLHDIGKHLGVDDSLEIMEKYYRDYVNYPEWSYHQFTGAFLAKQLFPLINNGCIDAILRHCTGDANMSVIQKIIYLSDKIEPTRGYDSSAMIEECKKDYKVGFVTVLGENIKFIIENNGSASDNLLTSKCIDAYLN